MGMYIVGSLFFFWLLTLSFLFYRLRRHYHKLTTRTKNYTIDEILETLIQDDQEVKKDISQIKKGLEETILRSASHFHKVGIVRFDPYGKKGEGSSSFVLALLDSHDSGLVLTFLYTHEGVRVYGKKVKGGRGEEHQLSDEEQKAIEKST